MSTLSEQLKKRIKFKVVNPVVQSKDQDNYIKQKYGDEYDWSFEKEEWTHKCVNVRFSDGESEIKKVWVGVTPSYNCEGCDKKVVNEHYGKCYGSLSMSLCKECHENDEEYDCGCLANKFNSSMMIDKNEDEYYICQDHIDNYEEKGYRLAVAQQEKNFIPWTDDFLRETCYLCDRYDGWDIENEDAMCDECRKEWAFDDNRYGYVKIK